MTRSRIVIVGAGPGGLFLARSLLRMIPDVDVDVIERNPEGAGFGFGVVFSDRAVSALVSWDPELGDGIVSRAVSWRSMELRHADEAVRWSGFGMSGIARATLLELMTNAAREAGATVRFGEEAHPDDIVEADLVVGADGVNSVTRAADQSGFGTTQELGTARYIWLGTDAPFTCMTFSFVQTEHGSFALHAYPYADGLSTFLVETADHTWERAFGPQASALDGPSLAYLEGVFTQDLRGARLSAGNSAWMRFKTIRNRAWSSEDRVLIGDAAHTAHFSLGSGTRMAIEDAHALASALASAPSVAEAVVGYEHARRRTVERLQSRAATSRRWWETFDRRLKLAPSSLAFNYVTRTGALDVEGVRAADRRFVDQVAAVLDAGPLDVLVRPATAGRLKVEGRAVVVPGSTEPMDGATVVSPVIGLVISRQGEALDSMTRASQDQRGKEALLGIEVPSLASQVVGAALQRGPAYLELSIRHVPRSGLEDLRSAVDFARSCSPTLAIGIGVQDPGAADRDMYTRIGSLIDHVEPDIIRVSTADTDDDSIERAVELSEWIRLVRQRATILDAGLGARDARTALLAGRADLVVLDPPAVALGELDIALARFLAAVEAVPRTRWHDGAPDAWSITEILGHVAEMLPYWAREAADVAAPQGEEPFGRTHDDPERIAAVERARSVRPDLAIGAIEPAVAATQEHLYRISPAGWAQTGRHARRGQMSALAIVRVFLVDHLLEHADQVEARSTAGPR